jgi:uncharacterized protein (TIGR03435 family)
MKSQAFYLLGVAVCAACIALGQHAARPTFDVVSVKLTPKGAKSAAPIAEPGRLRYEGALMRNILWMAFGVAGDEIIGLGSASESVSANSPDPNRYTIDATYPEGTTKAQISLMYESLLVDRFGLVYHWEKRETKGYLLTVDAKGSKLTRSTGQKSLYIGGGPGVLMGDPMSMYALTRQLTQIVGAPVVDRTHLEGDFKIRVKYLRDDAPPGTEGASIFTALREELGLRLQAGKPLIDYLVIDQLNRTPTEN